MKANPYVGDAKWSPREPNLLVKGIGHNVIAVVITVLAKAMPLCDECHFLEFFDETGKA
jgi:hypothetical protein